MQLDDPVKFFEYMTGNKPYDYQTNFLRCESKKIAVKSGRQVGKTTMCAVKILYKAFWNKNFQILIIAPVKEQSKYLFQMIKDFAKDKPEIKKAIVRETATMMFFDYGSRIYCLSGAILSKDRIRGFSPNLMIIDEAAYVPDETFEALKPSIIKTKGEINLISTPYGKRGFFYEAFQGDEYTKFHIKSEDCPHIGKKDLKIEKERLTSNEYLQEYEGEFTEESDTYFTKELIRDCLETIKEIDMPESGRKYFIGVDCARFGEDETVYIIRDDLGRVTRLLFDSMQPSTVVIARIKYLYDIFKFQNINFDASGTGGAVKDILFAEGYPIVGYIFSIVGKEKLYRNLKSLMEHGKVKFPKHEKLVRQLENLTQSFSLQGARIQAPSGQHDDFCDALVLAFADMRPITEEETESFFVY